MDRIWKLACDKNSASIIVYGKSGETKAYTDKATTTQYTTSELRNAFLKGCVIMIDNDLYRPSSFTVSSDVGTLTYAKAGTTSGTAATATLTSVKG